MATGKQTGNGPPGYVHQGPATQQPPSAARVELLPASAAEYTYVTRTFFAEVPKDSLKIFANLHGKTWECVI